MAALLADTLAKPITIEGQPHIALAETASPIGNSAWFWTDDNAKALELFSLPELHDSYPKLARGLLNFVLQMGNGECILRRWSAPQLQVIKDNCRDFLVVNCFARFSGDLSRGLVEQSIRFNDGREAPIVTHTGNYLEFDLYGRRHVLDVEDAIDSHGIIQSADKVTLFHESDMQLGAFAIGRLRVEYQIFAHHPVMKAKAVFRPARRSGLSNIWLTLAWDQLGRCCQFQSVTIDCGQRRQVVDRIADAPNDLHSGPMQFYSFSEEKEFGHAKTAYARPQIAEGHYELRAEGQTAGRLHWLVSRYRFDRIDSSDLIAEEDRVLVGGAIPNSDHGFRVLQDPRFFDGRDLAISYDYGAELNAAASFLLFSKEYRTGRPTDAEVTLVRSWYDRHLGTYLHTIGNCGGVYLRGLAFVLMSLAAMVRLTGDQRYLRRMQDVRRKVLDKQDINGDAATYREPDEPAYLDCQGAVILALARCAAVDGADSELSVAVRRALNALALSSEWEGTAPFASTIGVVCRTAKRGPRIDSGRWAYKSALLLRALRAVDMQADVLGLTTGETARLRRLHAACLQAISVCLVSKGKYLEILTSRDSRETNSETQPWGLLALLEPCGNALADQEFPRIAKVA